MGFRNNFDGIDVHKGNINNLERNFARFRHVPWEFQCYLYDGVKDFFVAENERDIQHISWIYYLGDPNRFVMLENSDAEIKYCLTLPAYRGHGIYPEVLKTISQYLWQNGIRRVFMCVNKQNQSSIRGIEKAGFRQVGQIHYQKSFGIQISKRYKP